MNDDQSTEETPRYLTKPRISPYKKLGDLIKNSLLLQFTTRSAEREWQSYQTRSHAIVLHNTLLSVCIEKAVCMKGEEGIMPQGFRIS